MKFAFAFVALLAAATASVHRDNRQNRTTGISLVSAIFLPPRVLAGSLRFGVSSHVGAGVIKQADIMSGRVRVRADVRWGKTQAADLWRIFFVEKDALLALLCVACSFFGRFD